MRPLDLLAQWRPEPVLATLVAAAALYLRAVRRARRWPAWRTAAWLLGLAALAVALASGFDAADDRLLSAHMVQHLLLTMVAPPLLLAGGPLTLALRTSRAARRASAPLQAAAAIAHPAFGVIALAAVTLLTHLTPLYGLAVRHPLAHVAEHALYLGSALVFWAPLVSPAPVRRAGPIAAVAMIMIAMPPMVVVGLWLGGDAVRYAEYPRLHDQHLASTLMLAGGVVALLVATFAVVWPAMLREERRAQVALARAPLLALALLLALAAPAVAQDGKALFEAGCSSCHGADGRGIRGRGPSLAGAGAWRTDFYLRTGRMPLDDPGDQPRRSPAAYDKREIRALDAYVAGLGRSSRAPHADPAAGDLSQGQKLFTSHCAGCHQIVAQGGTTTGARVPDLQESTPDDVAQAIRMGPFLMPVFNEKQLDQHDVDSIARYVRWTRDPPDAGGWAIGHLGPLPEGMITWFVGMLLLVGAIRLIGERTTR